MLNAVQPQPQPQPQPLDDRDRALISLLAAGRSVGAAAVELGVSEQTAYRRMRRPGFRAALADARAVRWRPVADELRDGALTAARRLLWLTENAQHESTQVRAATAVIELAAKLKKVVDDEPSLAALEARADEVAPAAGWAERDGANDADGIIEGEEP